jgi:hypothetical protein
VGTTVAVGTHGGNVFRLVEAIIREPEDVMDFQEPVSVFIDEWRRTVATIAPAAGAQQCISPY